MHHELTEQIFYRNGAYKYYKLCEAVWTLTSYNTTAKEFILLMISCLCNNIVIHVLVQNLIS